MIRKRIMAVAQKPPQKVLKKITPVYPICVINTHTRPLSRPLTPKRRQSYDG